MDIKIVEVCSELGFTVAGFVEDIYEDAVICIPPMFEFDLEKCPPICGRVLHIMREYPSIDGHFIVRLVLEQDGTGLQIPLTYGKDYHVFFKLPEMAEAV